MDPGAAPCHPRPTVCLAVVQLASSPQLLAGFLRIVSGQNALRARDPINQLVPKFTFPAPKGVLKRLDTVLSQLGCVFKLASFTWGRKTVTGVEQAQS